MKIKDLIGKTVREMSAEDGVEIIFEDGVKFVYLESSPERDPDIGVVDGEGKMHKIKGHPDLYFGL